MSEDQDKVVDMVLSTYREFINKTPVLLSILYDADLLPEQIVSRRGAISMAACCEAYKAGLAKNDQA